MYNIKALVGIACSAVIKITFIFFSYIDKDASALLTGHFQLS